ncbi:hypothetical protein DXG03_009638, partial [Asterophora parasitica]
MDPHRFKDQQWTDPQWQAEGQTQGNPTPQPDQQPQGPTMAQPTWADFAQLVQGFTSMGCPALPQAMTLQGTLTHSVKPLRHTLATPTLLEMQMTNSLPLSKLAPLLPHASQYTELLIHVDWSKQMKIDNFYCSLKTSVKDAIMLTCLQDCPKVFKKYVDFVIKIDNH